MNAHRQDKLGEPPPDSSKTGLGRPGGSPNLRKPQQKVGPPSRTFTWGISRLHIGPRLVRMDYSSRYTP